MLAALIRAIRRSIQRRTLGPGALLGAWGEDLACAYLESQGLAIHARNWTPLNGRGEIDAVAIENGVLVFVEIKSRATAEYGAPDRAIGIEKRRAIARAARRFYNSNSFAPRIHRFDTVSVVWPEFPGRPRRASIEHVRDAFFLDGIHPAEWKPHMAKMIDGLHPRAEGR